MATDNILALSRKSRLIPIPANGMLTFVGFGLERESIVTFEIARVTEARVSNDCQGTTVTELPAIGSTTEYKILGQTIALTKDNPFIVIDAPQGFSVRAVQKAGDEDVLLYYSESTNVGNVNNALRGYMS